MPARNGPIPATPVHKRSTRLSQPKLTAAEVHLIRTNGKTDSENARRLKRTVGTIRDARVGNTWRDHPTPPDNKPRGARGNWNL